MIFPCDIVSPWKQALLEAEKAFHRDEVPVGAVIVEGKTGKIISTAHNEMRERKDPTAHAELLAIQRACRALSENRLPTCDLYVTLEPCPLCAHAMSLARIRRLYFGAYDPKGGGVDHGVRIFEALSCVWKPEIFGGFEAEACGELLKKFFQQKRQKR